MKWKERSNGQNAQLSLLFLRCFPWCFINIYTFRNILNAASSSSCLFTLLKNHVKATKDISSWMDLLPNIILNFPYFFAQGCVRRICIKYGHIWWNPMEKMSSYRMGLKVISGFMIWRRDFYFIDHNFWSLNTNFSFPFLKTFKEN